MVQNPKKFSVQIIVLKTFQTLIQQISFTLDDIFYDPGFSWQAESSADRYLNLIWTVF